jgi:hypothetical protein
MARIDLVHGREFDATHFASIYPRAAYIMKYGKERKSDLRGRIFLPGGGPEPLAKFRESVAP